MHCSAVAGGELLFSSSIRKSDYQLSEGVVLCIVASRKYVAKVL